MDKETEQLEPKEEAIGENKASDKPKALVQSDLKAMVDKFQ